MASPDPRSTYEARLAAHQETAQAAGAAADRIADLRLVAFVAALGLFIAALTTNLTPHLLWLPLAAFAWLVIRHGQATERKLRAERAMRFHEAALRRLDGTWPGTGRTAEGLAPAGHLYAPDLDLTGEGSLFELLCTARTAVGEQRLADWLLAPATPEVIRSRQGAVRELAGELTFRETLAIEEGDVARAMERGTAEAWGVAPRKLAGTIEPWIHGVVAAVSTGALITWLATDRGGLVMLVSMVVQYVLAARRRGVVTDVLEHADRPAQDLALVGRLLEHLEGASFTSDHLAPRIAKLAVEGVPPSRRIARLSRLMDLVDARHNQIFLPISFLLSLGTQLAFRLEAWRAENGETLASWLDVLAEVEALSSLAAHAGDHPDDPYPTILDDGSTRFEGTGLAHPLLPRSDAVSNDVCLARGADVPQAFLISGSNMSGKSTLMRTVGVNTALAFAGAPVLATSLTLSPLAVAASIRIHDSLQEGASRFYAEIARLKQVVDLTDEATPVLFLLDEILHGTNSHDRCIGAAAVVQQLVERGAIGLVSTHDLALADMENTSEGRIRNMHFEDQVVDGEMAFDYTLRPGVVERSNAIALMRMVGLDVDD